MNIQKQPQEVSIKKTILKNFAIFTGKHLCWSLCFDKVAGYIYERELIIS